MKALIAVLAGDGIGTEVTAEAVRALDAVAARFGHAFEFEPALLGGAAIDATGQALPAATLALCAARRCDSAGRGRRSEMVRLPHAQVRPEQGLLQLRKALGLFANLRPVVPHPALLDASPIKAEAAARRGHHGGARTDRRHLFRREDRGPPTRPSTYAATRVEEIERVVRLAARLAAGPPASLTSVDKANVLETSRLWRATVERIMPGGISRRDLRTHAGGFRGHASAAGGRATST